MKKNFKKIISLLLAVVMTLLIIPTNLALTTAQAATFGTTTTLKKGSSGTQVKYLQYGLAGLGYLKDTVDGKFGSNTEAAVKSYQKANGLTADGLAGPKTLTSLKSKVSDIQTKLKEHGYYTSTVDGIFGSGTTTAVKNFQKAKGLTQDGIVGPKTLEKLNEKVTVATDKTTTTTDKTTTTTDKTTTTTDKTTTTTNSTIKVSITSLYQTGDSSKIYYNNKKKSTTVAKSGCAGVSLAMALNSLLKTKKYTGQNVMQWFANNGYYAGSGTWQEGIYKYPKKLGLKSAYADSMSDLESHLKKGRVAVAIMKNKTGEAYFTSKNTSGHYILISGYRVKNGVKQVYVNNPMKTKTSGWFSMSKMHANTKNEKEGYKNSYVIVYK